MLAPVAQVLPRAGEPQERMPKRYAISDGKIVLTLESAPEGGYVVTSPLDPELITEAETVDEAFGNARDALRALGRSRARLLRSAPLKLKTA